MATVYQTRAQMMCTSLAVFFDILDNATSTTHAEEVIAVLGDLRPDIRMFKTKVRRPWRLPSPCLKAHQRVPKQALSVISTATAGSRLHHVCSSPAHFTHHHPNPSHPSFLPTSSGFIFSTKLVSARFSLSSKQNTNSFFLSRLTTHGHHQPSASSTHNLLSSSLP